MKLFTRYSRINLLATVFVFLLSGIAFYFLLQYVLIDQVDEDLKIEQNEIESYVGKYQHLPEVITVKDQRISYLATGKAGGRRAFSTIRMTDGNKKEKELFRQLNFFIRVDGQWYKATVSKSLEGTDDMLQSIATITFITILLMLIVSLLINRIVLRRLWKPFYDTLTAMRSFELGKKGHPEFQTTGIDEFNVMNDTLRQATEKAYQDYQHLKEFTENASHELQTPLAIIRSKMDVLIQDEHLSEPQSRAVQAAYEAIQRMSRLSQGLLLLTKIENGQYNDVTSIGLSQKIKEKLLQFGEIIESKKISVIKDLDDTVSIPMNPALADILLNNLFSNAIRYNFAGGKINVRVKTGVFEISNTGPDMPLDEQRLFRRFGKTGQTGDGIGLGLAIVQQVAAISGLTAHYLYYDQQHHFKLINN
ncbi:MAG TPA: HAMP domain-containing sensor histidine kinase [Puia sp.]|nr:HAMP domain-containing sensor histidine kinase [Puia sp.]